MYTQKVLTNRGIINADQVIVGDYLYEYGTSKMLEIRYIEQRRNERLYDVRYSDGRIEKLGESSKIYFAEGIHDIWKMEGKSTIYVPMERYVVDFGKLIPPLHPDSYSAGALLCYGDVNDIYISLPWDKTKAIDNILYNNGWDIYAEAADVIYFQKQGSSNKLRWEDTFTRGVAPMDLYMADHAADSPIIPDEYRANTPEERIKFIRGVFDTGYSKDVTPDTLSILLNDNRIYIVQRMLWSLGIMSYIDTIKDSMQLNIIGPEKDYAAFFYDVENRARMINTDYTVYKCDPRFELHLESVLRSLFHHDETCYYFETEKPQAIYYSDKYLPRVSL